MIFLRSLCAEGTIKKIKLYLLEYSSTLIFKLRWLLGLKELFYEIKPEWLGALSEEVFYTIRMLGATEVYVKTRACWEQTEMMLLLV